MSWYTPSFSTHRRDIHYTFDIENNNKSNTSQKRKQTPVNPTSQPKKRKVENKTHAVKRTTKQKPKPKPKTSTNTKAKTKTITIKKQLKPKQPSLSIDEDSFLE